MKLTKQTLTFSMTVCFLLQTGFLRAEENTDVGVTAVKTSGEADKVTGSGNLIYNMTGTSEADGLSSQGDSYTPHTEQTMPVYTVSSGGGTCSGPVVTFMDSGNRRIDTTDPDQMVYFKIDYGANSTYSGTGPERAMQKVEYKGPYNPLWDVTSMTSLTSVSHCGYSLVVPDGLECYGINMASLPANADYSGSNIALRFAVYAYNNFNACTGASTNTSGVLSTGGTNSGMGVLRD